MTVNGLVQIGLYLVILIAAARPLGAPVICVASPSVPIVYTPLRPATDAASAPVDKR